ncbi:vitrin isoform X2 [Pristis pectinata]|uniref:vitrin isoform X2 n=1 Tax=Pristis pectinata TaxID=685728 RepID=UPI00223E8BF2|nr:vitrin isoform X2 [Pristis pectinata]
MCLSAVGAFTLVLLLTLADGVRGKEQRSKRPSVPQIDCDIRAGKVKVSEFVAQCPPGCLGTKQAVWGTDVYASVSSVCVAAIHSGVIKNGGGKILVRKVPNSSSYKGTFSNGVRSLSLPRWRESFVVSAPKLQKGVTYPSILEFLPPRSSRIRTARLKTTRAPAPTSTQPTTVLPSTRQTVTTRPAPREAPTAHLPRPRGIGVMGTSGQPASPWPPLLGGREPAFRETGVSEFNNRNYPLPHAGVHRSEPAIAVRQAGGLGPSHGFTRQAQLERPRADWPLPPVKARDNDELATDPAYTWAEEKTLDNPAYSSKPGLSDYQKWVLGLGEGTHNHRVQDLSSWTLGSSDHGQRLGRPANRPWEYSPESLTVQNQNTDETEINFWKSDFDARGFSTRDQDLIEEPISRGDPNCKVDLAFLVDGSWSIGRRRFGIQKKFLMSVAEALDIGIAGPLIGIVQFGTNASIEFNLQTYHNSRHLKSAIEKIPQKGGLSNVGRALSHTIGNFFSSEQGNRGGAPNVVVVLVDGWPTDKVGETARLARESGINIFFITVEGADQNERQNMVEKDFVDKSVCRTSGYFSIHVPSWFQLQRVVAPLVSRVCDTERLACSKTCLNSADIGFVVDGSSSVGTGNFRTVLQFVANISREFEISDTATRVGVVQYTYEQRLEFGFGEHNTREAVDSAIKNIRYWSGGTSTGEAITYASKHLFSKSKPNKRKLMIVITDGRSYDDVQTPALAAHRNGVIAYAVGIAWAAMDELEYIATDPDKDHSFFVDDFDSLYQFVPRIVHNICQEFNSQPRN